MVRHLTVHQYDDDYAARPALDDRDAATVVPAAVAEVLDLAETWLGWDGRPICREGNTWTPHKALRRVADHLLDHLAVTGYANMVGRLPTALHSVRGGWSVGRPVG